LRQPSAQAHDAIRRKRLIASCSKFKGLSAL
jgi:hypothetical protein